MRPANEAPVLIYCAAGNKRFADIALRYGLRYGAQLTKLPVSTVTNWATS